MSRQSSTISQNRVCASLLSLLIVSCVCGSQSVRADDSKDAAAARDPKTEKVDAKAKPATAVKEKRVFITGSAIPRKVTRNQRIVTSSEQPVSYIDQDDIQHSGGASTAEIIRKTVIVKP